AGHSTTSCACFVEELWSGYGQECPKKRGQPRRLHGTDNMPDTHPNTRLEAFCDAVFAIALTLLIIDIKVPGSEGIGTTRELWLALTHLAPSIFAFVLSFVIILIAWVNHHSLFRLLNKSSGPFVYANGFLLLTVVFMPFPTGLISEYLLTDHVAPA